MVICRIMLHAQCEDSIIATTPNMLFVRGDHYFRLSHQFSLDTFGLRSFGGVIRKLDDVPAHGDMAIALIILRV